MKISQLIEKLEKIKEIEGDIEVANEEDHEYWGSIYHPLTEVTVSSISLSLKNFENIRAVFLERFLRNIYAKA